MGHNVTEYLRQSGSKERKSRQRKRTAQKAVGMRCSADFETQTFITLREGGCDDLGVPSDWVGHRRVSGFR